MNRSAIASGVAALLRGGSGPAVARLFQRLLGGVFLIAWLSLAAQVRGLIGERGLLPLRALLDEARSSDGLPLLGFPTLLRWAPLADDRVLLGGTLVGAALAVLAMLRVRPRLVFAASTVLYLSYASACRTFLAFQWDNLLLECGLLAVFLPADRPSPVAHFVFRVLLFKLYFQSGIAKWLSPLRDWHDGSAMTYYFETAPLPTFLAWYAHEFPGWWHRLEAWATLVLELVLPVGIFGPRRARLVAAFAFTAFQVFNVATANYGFFCYLAVALHVFLLDDADLRFAWLRAPVAERPAARSTARRRAAIAGAALYVLLSTLDAAVHFTAGGRWLLAALPLRSVTEPLRLVNTYHLFASITRERIEPTFETLEAGAWTERHLHHKPGDPARAPNFVAPHQPRIDFQLWFYGLSYTDREPLWVANLARRLCGDSAAVQGLFRDALPAAPQAVRIRYWQYTFTTAVERRATGAWWTRTLRDTTPPFPCDR